MTVREPARERYDAMVGLDPGSQEAPSFAYALVKLTYEVQGRDAVAVAPEPLVHDIWNDETLTPRLPCGSDFWFQKPGTDVLVRGRALTPGGEPFRSTTVSVKIGERTKRVAVFGQRIVEWSAQGTPTFTDPLPTNEVPLVYQHAYGGLDDRVAIPEAQAAAYDRLLRDGMAYDHPGLYPRNPVGKGYLALPGKVDGLLLPQLEDPSDLLTPDRLTSGAPELWYRQPLPWCFEWMVGTTFPRCRYLGLDAWYPGPDGVELPEVARGYALPEVKATARTGSAPPLGFLQEASLGMTFATPLEGQQVQITGMTANDRVLQFVVPAAPRLVMVVEGTREELPTRLINFALFPNEQRFTLTYAARNRGLPRVYIPGMHKVIPISISVDGESPVPYDTPPTVRERLKQQVGAS